VKKTAVERTLNISSTDHSCVRNNCRAHCVESVEPEALEAVAVARRSVIGKVVRFQVALSNKAM